VIARTSAFSFKGKNEDVRHIAQALGVTNVLEGTCAGPATVSA
jgi:TolB-like protein